MYDFLFFYCPSLFISRVSLSCRSKRWRPKMRTERDGSKFVDLLSLLVLVGYLGSKTAFYRSSNEQNYFNILAAGYLRQEIMSRSYRTPAVIDHKWAILCIWIGSHSMNEISLITLLQWFCSICGWFIGDIILDRDNVGDLHRPWAWRKDKTNPSNLFIVQLLVPSFSISPPNQADTNVSRDFR